MSKELADITFGQQLDRLTARHTYFTHLFWKRHDIKMIRPELAGHEDKLIIALGNAICERMALMRMYGSEGLAAEIVQSRKSPETIKDRIAQTGDY